MNPCEIRCSNRSKTLTGLALALCLITCAGLQGCGSNADIPEPEVSDASAGSKDGESNDADSVRDDMRSTEFGGRDQADPEEMGLIERALLDQGGSGLSSSTVDSDVAVQRLQDALQESLELGPTIAIWIIDQSPNAESFCAPLCGSLARCYSSFARDEPESLESIVVGVNDEVQFLHSEPTADHLQIAETLQAIEFSGQEQQNLNLAIQSVLDRLESERRRGKELFIVCVTNESCSDPDKIETTIQRCDELIVPIDIIGLPAPFGRIGNESSSQTGRENQGLVVGPETCVRARLYLQFPSSAESNEWLDSGFGPWDLERICRQTGGHYLMVRERGGLRTGLLGGGWPQALARRFDDEVMSRYRPDYRSRQEIEAAIEASPLRRALTEAAQRGYVGVQASYRNRFNASDQTRLVNQISEVQRQPALVLPNLEMMKNLLQQGEASRADESDPRWQAAFDLALGRILAAYSRADGYNTMLAELKRGKPFENDANDTWVLEPTETFDSAGSSIRNASQKARNLLEGVIADHPGTPWAYLAEQELSFPLGWKWGETKGSQ